MDTVAVLYRRHGQALCRHARTIVESRDVAEDVVHEVFRRVIERADRLVSRLNSAYLHQAVRNEALHWIERRRVRLALGMHAQPTMRSIPPSPENELDARTRTHEISRAIDALPQRGRQAFILVHVEGRTYAKAANIMGISPETLKVHLRRSRQVLRKRLTKYSDIV